MQHLQKQTFVYCIIFCERNFMIFSSSYPRTLDKTSSVCCPKVGGPVRAEFSASLNVTGGPTTLTSPAVECFKVLTMPISLTCGSSNTCCILLTGPKGKVAFSKAVFQ